MSLQREGVRRWAAGREADERRVVLVTGAPRSGTTPVGAALSFAPGAKLLYEPMGPTGDDRIPCRYAIAGTDLLPSPLFEEFIHDLKALRLHLRPQVRQSYSRLPTARRVMQSIVGSRTRASYLLARMAVRTKTIVWKDPMAAFSLPAILALGIPVVVCVRGPHAHAASFKRMDWKGNIRPIYANYSKRYGRVLAIEHVLDRGGSITSVENASILWHMIYSIALLELEKDVYNTSPLYVVTGEALERCEVNMYRRLYDRLQLRFEGRPSRILSKRISTSAGSAAAPRKTHDFTRTVESTNSYWTEVLNEKEQQFIAGMNSQMYTKVSTQAAIRW